MIHLRSTQSRSLALIGFAVSLFCVNAALFAFKEGSASGLMLLLPCFYFIPLAILGWTAKTVAVDSRQVRITQKHGVEIVPMAEITGVRTMPVFRFVDVLWIEDSKGRTTRTLIQSDTLSQAMSMMPRAALTPYWQNRV